MKTVLDTAVVRTDHMMIVNTRCLGIESYLDPATDKELTFKHGKLSEAKKVNVSRTQRSIDFAMSGRPGFFWQNFSPEEYDAFNDAFDELYN